MIPAFVLKQGVERAAAKQLFSSAEKMSSWNRAPLVCTWSGAKAFALWDHEVRGDKQYVSARINYPAIADTALLTRKEADLFAAYTLHETGHVLYTNNEAVANAGMNDALFTIYNGIEDARMETCVVRSGRARGARTAFAQLASYMLRLAPEWTPNDKGNVAFSLAIIGRVVLYGCDLPAAANFLDRCAPEPRAFYEYAIEEMKKLPLGRDGSVESIALARKLYDMLKANEQPQPQPDQGQGQGSAPQQPGDAGDSDEQGQSGSSDSEGDDAGEESGGSDFGDQDEGFERDPGGEDAPGDAGDDADDWENDLSESDNSDGDADPYDTGHGRFKSEQGDESGKSAAPSNDEGEGEGEGESIFHTTGIRHRQLIEFLNIQSPMDQLDSVQLHGWLDKLHESNRDLIKSLLCKEMLEAIGLGDKE